jgi:orotate phosphoribosyltransferase
MNDETVLDIFRDTGALLSGHFELRSGLHSDQFFQCALVLQFPRIAEGLCVELVRRARAAWGAGPDPEAVIAPALGGIPVGHEVGRAFGVRALFAEKENGRLALRRGFRIGAGERFVVAEDVITRGGRVQETIDIVTGHGGQVQGVLTLVDRSGGRAAFAAPLVALVRMEPETWAPADCPLCRAGLPMQHPGS